MSIINTRQESFIEQYGFVRYTSASKLRIKYPISGQCEIPTCKNLATIYDHDHQTGWIRGLTCQSCNRILGIIESKFPYYKNTSLIPHLKQYLKTHRMDILEL